MQFETPFGSLKTSLKAARSVNSFFGSFLDAQRKLGSFDLDAFCVVIAAGLGKKVAEIEDDVYEHGLHDLVDPCVNFVNALSNGGQPLKMDATKKA